MAWINSTTMMTSSGGGGSVEQTFLVIRKFKSGGVSVIVKTAFLKSECRPYVV